MGASTLPTNFNGTIRKIDVATGSVTTFAGTPGAFGRADGIGAAASFNYPTGIAYDGSGVPYVADQSNESFTSTAGCPALGGGTIRRIDLATATVTTILANPGQLGVVLGAARRGLTDRRRSRSRARAFSSPT